MERRPEAVRSTGQDAMHVADCRGRAIAGAVVALEDLGRVAECTGASWW